MSRDLARYLTFNNNVDLRDPVLICAFKGWNDAGDAASFAAKHLRQVWHAEKIAAIDPEEFYDFQTVRPKVRLIEGHTRAISWPKNELWAARHPGMAHDSLILIGVEPNHRWRTFGELVVWIAQRYGVKLVITLGALLADVPHSRPVHITGTAANEELVQRLGLVRSRYEGPTGIVGVLHDAFATSGISSASLWAAVPHYLAVTPNPKAALALVEKTVELTRTAADIGDLQHATSIYDERVAEMVDADEDVRSYVQLLEERADEGSSDEETGLHEVPTAEEIAAELERFLRDQDS